MGGDLLASRGGLPTAELHPSTAPRWGMASAPQCLPPPFSWQSCFAGLQGVWHKAAGLHFGPLVCTSCFGRALRVHILAVLILCLVNQSQVRGRGVK